ncbi:protein kinase domain-containing protein [Sandaracinus amylolyticus]|uniref:protein kinase domain-containing protein n=1 Tax=Sandaracinus amylolyticus TaxID=927083 RepID=UPI001F37AFD3|nr:serine/threonine-protein kinase [Sandaracinus amylolyticus]UJR81621.1 Serine/threonine protein kinase PrkC, regulator of stationary phase [Sandaracinus amylolyticus]
MHFGLERGARIARKYRVVRELGRGAFGVVFEAENEATERRVAIKLLAAPEHDEAATARFLREARHAARLVHPNVVTVLDADRDPDRGWLYLVQELLVGEDLITCLRREGPLAPARAAQILVPVMDALSAAHAAGLVHRDVKPSNIYLAWRGRGSDELVPKLIDFGLTKSFEQDDGDYTATGLVVGTPSHMSPEQLVAPKEVGPQTDVWSMGVVWYQTLSGRLPFEGDRVADVAFRIVEGRPPPLASRAPSASSALAAAIDRALLRERERRWATMDELRSAIESALRAWKPIAPSIDVPLDDLEPEPFDEAEPTMFARRGARVRAAIAARAGRLRLGLVASKERDLSPQTALALGSHLGIEITLLRHASHADLVEALDVGELDLAWLSPVAFARANQNEIARGLACVELEDADDYAGVLVGHRARAPRLERFALTGTRAAWVDRWSAAGYTMPRVVLRAAGIEPEQTFLEQRFVGSYKAALAALREGSADVAGMYAYLDRSGRIASHGASGDPSLVVLATSDPIPPDVVAARVDLDEREVRSLIARLEHAQLAPADPLREATGASSFATFAAARYEALATALEGEPDA